MRMHAVGERRLASCKRGGDAGHNIAVVKGCTEVQNNVVRATFVGDSRPARSGPAAPARQS
eukprot:2216750-Prorocentrum_lima.AAC.1